MQILKKVGNSKVVAIILIVLVIIFPFLLFLLEKLENRSLPCANAICTESSCEVVGAKTKCTECYVYNEENEQKGPFVCEFEGVYCFDCT